MTGHVVIHRDRTFEFAGRRYRISQGSTRGTSEWSGYSIVAVLSDIPGDEADIEVGFWSFTDIRAYLRRAKTEGWEYLPDLDGDDPHARE